MDNYSFISGSQYDEDCLSVITTNTNNSNGLFTCHHEDCQKTFKHRSSLNRHLASHSKNKPLSCPYGNCKKTFARLDSLHAHIKIHS
mmetsp:Transcript_27571/g.24251  ORF Transcript_27571/g.24251 Transcript_27571/m.24251 type:complete len:87 (-) Transcript_27571:421-681(-)